jgi:hypothetical protein
LSIVNSGEEISECGHLIFVGVYLFSLLKDDEVIVGRPTQQIVRVIGGNENN